MRDLVFLSVDEGGVWTAEDPACGSAQGHSAEDALGELKSLRLRSLRQSLKGISLEGVEDHLANRSQEIETFTVDRCLPVALARFERALNEQFPNEPAPWWRRLFSKVMPIQVYRVVEHASSSLFQRVRVLEITSPGFRLETLIMPGGGSIGLFSFHGSELRCLNRRIENLEKTLRTEGNPIGSFDPTLLAQLVSEALGRRGNHWHKVVSVDALEEMERESLFGGGYELNRSELDRVHASVHAPLVRTAGNWALSFCTVGGWMHHIQELTVWSVEVSREFEVTVTQKTLSRKIFSKTPEVIY